MSYEAEQVAIFGKVKEFWDEAVMGPLAYPNRPKRAEPGSGKPRSTVSISHPAMGRSKESIGDAAEAQSLGFVFFTVHIANEAGTLEGRKIVDSIVDAMDEKAIITSEGDLITFGITYSQDLGLKEGTYRIIATVPFKRQEIG